MPLVTSTFKLATEQRNLTPELIRLSANPIRSKTQNQTNIRDTEHWSLRTSVVNVIRDISWSAASNAWQTQSVTNTRC